jgi:hypothetical protein
MPAHLRAGLPLIFPARAADLDLRRHVLVVCVGLVPAERRASKLPCLLAGDDYAAPPPKLKAPLPRSEDLGGSAGIPSTYGWKAAPLNKVGCPWSASGIHRLAAERRPFEQCRAPLRRRSAQHADGGKWQPALMAAKDRQAAMCRAMHCAMLPCSGPTGFGKCCCSGSRMPCLLRSNARLEGGLCLETQQMDARQGGPSQSALPLPSPAGLQRRPQVPSGALWPAL